MTNFLELSLYCSLCLLALGNVQQPLVINYAASGKEGLNSVIKSYNCSAGPFDLVFVLDESSSVRQDNFTLALNNLADMTLAFDIGKGQNQTQIGFVLFASTARLEFNLSRFFTNADVYEAIKSADYRGGGTNISDGMSLAISQVFVPPDDRPDIQNVMIIITDGQDNTSVATQQQLAFDKSIEIYALGIGNDINMNQLIAATGTNKTVHYIANYTDLDFTLGKICEGLGSGAGERSCACTHPKIWLDISILIESSSSMTKDGLSEISATLAAMIDDMTISQTIDQSSRIAITVFTTSPTSVSTFNTYTNKDKVIQDLIDLANNYYYDIASPNMLRGMQNAIGMFEGAGHRRNVRKVLIVVASSYAIGGQTDVQAIADQFKSNNGVIIVLGYQQPDQAPITGICDIASRPSATNCLTIISQLNNDAILDRLWHALCIANCFCYKNDAQYTSGVGDFLLQHGTCLHGVLAPTTWTLAELACAMEGVNKYGNETQLVQILNQDKLSFLTTFTMDPQHLGANESWIGLRYQAPNGWYWIADRPTPIAGTTVDQEWNPGQPNLALGECVQLKPFMGFILRLSSAPCTGRSLPYTCQYHACDTDKYCATALSET